MEWTKDNYRISDDKSELDLFYVVPALQHSYWAAERPKEVVEEQGIAKVSDRSAIEPLCRRLVQQHAEQARSVRSGKKSVLGFFVGRVMKETRGSADPHLVTEILEQLISELE